jgi:hypothetical protein
MRIFRQQNPTRLSDVTVAWGVLFAIVHAYWAAGGAAGMNGDSADTPATQGYIGGVTLLGLVGTGVAYGLGHDRSAWPGRATLTLLARAGGAALLLGVAFGAGGWVADGGVGDDGTAGVAITLYFLLGGVLFSALGRRPGAPARVGRRA